MMDIRHVMVTAMTMTLLTGEDLDGDGYSICAGDCNDYDPH